MAGQTQTYKPAYTTGPKGMVTNTVDPTTAAKVAAQHAAAAPVAASAPAPAAPAAPGGGLFGGLRNQFTGAVQAGLQAAKPIVAQAQTQRNAAIASNTPDTIDQQTGAARTLGSNLQQQGQSIFNQQTAASNGFANQGQNYQAGAQSITAPGGMTTDQQAYIDKGNAYGQSISAQVKAGTMTPQQGNAAMSAYSAQNPVPGVQRTPSGAVINPGRPTGGLTQIQGGLTGGSGAAPGMPAAPAGPPAFQVGQRAAAGNMGSVSNVDPSGLGAYGSVAGGLGAAPGAVSRGSLGNVGMSAGQVPGVASQLGGAPQVGNVGNIGTGAAPGAVQGTFGNQGAQSADQAGMMGRLNGFLDAPEGPSVAQAQLAQAQAQNMGQMIGLARSGRGGAGAQAQALEGAMSEGGAVASDTAGQMATLRAQEEDMRKNRALSAIGLGGNMATDARGQDLSFRGQNLTAAQGDQSTQLGARGQDLTASMANQQTQTQLEGLRAQTALGARGQNLGALQGDQSSALSALQGDQSAQLGVRGQNLSAAQGNQQTALGARGQNLDAMSTDVQAQIAARGQNLGALQGNQQAQLGARGQNIQQEGNILGANTTMRQQDLGALTSDADRNLAAQQLSLQGQLGFGGLQNDATGQGLQYMSQANQQALGAEGLAQGATSDYNNMVAGINNTNTMADAGILNNNNNINAQPSFAEKAALLGIGGLFQAGGAIGGALIK
jgi:hypothetical protein